MLRPDIDYNHLPDDQWVDTHVAAKITGFSRRTLEDKRTDGRGPPYSKPDGYVVRYRVGDLRAWAGQRKPHVGYVPARAEAAA